MYRLFRMRDGAPCTLFHGVRGSRTLPVGEWVEAENKEVRDGSGGTWYESGFHVLTSRKKTARYKENFDQATGLVVCRVLVDGRIRLKEHARSAVYLADRIFVPEVIWANKVAKSRLEAPLKREERFLRGVSKG